MNKYKIQDAYDKTKKVVLSCRTFKQLHSSLNMINNFKAMFDSVDVHGISEELYRCYEKRAEVIEKYGKTLEGTRVLAISNQDEKVGVGRVITFDDFAKPHQSFLPVVVFDNEPEKHCLCMGVVLPYTKGIEDELNGMEYKKRWETACDISRKMRNSLQL